MNTLIADDDGTLRNLLDERGPAAWGEATGVLARRAFPRLPTGEPARLKRFREQLRSELVHWSASGNVRPALIRLLNRHLARDPERSEVVLQKGEVLLSRRPAGSPLNRLYGAVARSAADMIATDDPERLRTCANPTCRLMFYDVSKAGRRRWCSLQTCWARAKMRARYAAQRTFGNVDVTKEEARDTRRTATIENLLKDLRYTLRGLLRAPVLLITAAISIALGAVGNIAVFSLAREILFITPHAREPETLVKMRVSHGSHASFQRWKDLDASGAVQRIAGYSFEEPANWFNGDAAISVTYSHHA